MGIGDGSTTHRQRGAVAVELALVLPLLIMLLMGVIDVGRLVFTQISLQDAAQEGALFAAYRPGSPALVTERVRESVGDEGTFISAMNVSVGSCNLASGQITVTVNGTVDLITPFMSQIVGDNVQLGRSITAPILVQTCA